MKNLNQNLEKHYYKEGLYEDILNRLRDLNIDLDSVRRADIEGVDEFHVRGATVSREIAGQINLQGLKVLDVGCGLGGPCRMLAEMYDCDVTGLDLSLEFVSTAEKLSQLVKLDHKTKFVVGNATELPFENSSFDAVWTQHVQMNIPDKHQFYSEIHRVLKPGGFFLYYDIFKSNDEEVTYPMPWASTSDLSFLAKTHEMQKILRELGFKKTAKRSETKAGIEFFEALVARLKEFGPPKMGLNLLMGDSTKNKLLNLLDHLKIDALELESGIYLKSQY